jgi:CheY-like chemotaxis protein
MLDHEFAEILLVEDNPGDVRLVQEALKEGGLDRCRLSVVGDGEQALAFLRRGSPFEGSPRPTFILLDLNLPRKKGQQVLEEIKKDQRLQKIPVFILSTSTHSEDINNAYASHANCYIAKPGGVSELVEIGKIIEAFWLRTVTLPPSA